MKYVLIPCVINKPIDRDVARTFDESVKMVKLSTTFITNYSDEEQLQDVFHEISKNVEELAKELTDEDEVYLLFVGSNYHIMVAMMQLQKHNIKHKILIYERKIGGLYVPVEVKRDGVSVGW